MMRQIDSEDVLNYLRADASDGGIPANGFRLAVNLLTALLGTLERVATEQALTNLAFHVDDRQRAWLKQLAEAANRIDEAGMTQAISEELYHAQKDRFGEHNPDLMTLAFWKFMIQQGWTAWRARMQFDYACQAYMQHLHENPPPDLAQLDTMGEEEQAAWAATAPHYAYGSAVWSFWRFGQSCTKLADGREIWIGGEHEDWYDCDFYIYNDVIVIHPNLAIDIYGYPRNVFSPTDSHSATLVDDSIYIIGNLGHLGNREPGETPVYRLDCQSFQIERLSTEGEKPGWIYGHTAAYVAEGHRIKVTQGKVFLRWDGKRQSRKNRKTYWLDLATGQWSCGKAKKEERDAHN